MLTVAQMVAILRKFPQTAQVSVVHTDEEGETYLEPLGVVDVDHDTGGPMLTTEGFEMLRRLQYINAAEERARQELIDAMIPEAKDQDLTAEDTKRLESTLEINKDGEVTLCQ